MLKQLRRFDFLLCQELPLLILLLIVITLRLPNFFEPYWYGDEAIYLTIGQALKYGVPLYQGIVDHKTPLIYYFALVPSQLWFRFLLLSWMLVTTSLFYHIALRISRSLTATVIAATGFVIFTTLPWFEGNIPNGELFVMGFVFAGGLLLLYTKLFKDFFAEKTTILIESKRFSHPIQQAIGQWLNQVHDNILYLTAGVFFGLAVLTKVPAVLDAAAFLAVCWFIMARMVMKDKKVTTQTISQIFIPLALRGLLIVAGLLLPILVSILYFWSRGSLQDYLDFGLLYNFRYVQTWQPNFPQPWLRLLFTLPAKAAIVAFSVLLLTIKSRRLQPSVQFAVSWSMIALFAALLSNRPYPHYFLQVLPPICLLIGLTISQSTKQLYELKWSVLTTGLLISILFVLDVGLYPVAAYYGNFFRYAAGQISRETYYQSFDRLIADNYAAAKIIDLTNDQYLFIWGTNPLLYALTKKIPPGRFTVSFHIKDLGVYQETMIAVKKIHPRFIVVMKNETTPLPGLNEYLSQSYIMNSNFQTFELWKRL